MFPSRAMALACTSRAAPRAVPIRRPRPSPSSAASKAAASLARARRAMSRGNTWIPPISPPCSIASLIARSSMLNAPDYLRDGAAIYERSFAIIRAEADLSRFTPAEAEVAVRMIHACGQVEVAQSIEFGPGLVEAARGALERGAPIFCDAAMVAHGITRARLPANNEVVCTLRDPSVPELAAKLGTTRSAAALALWGQRLEGALVAIGNAPTALFRL